MKKEKTELRGSFCRERRISVKARRARSRPVDLREKRKRTRRRRWCRNCRGVGSCAAAPSKTVFLAIQNSATRKTQQSEADRAGARKTEKNAIYSRCLSPSAISILYHRSACAHRAMTEIRIQVRKTIATSSLVRRTRDCREGTLFLSLRRPPLDRGWWPYPTIDDDDNDDRAWRHWDTMRGGH